MQLRIVAPLAFSLFAAPALASAAEPVHVHFEADEGAFVQKQDGDVWRRLCTTPCVADLENGDVVRIRRKERGERPVEIHASPGDDVVVRYDDRSDLRWGLVGGGIGTAAAGATGAFLGFAWMLGNAMGNVYGSPETRTETPPLAIGLMVAGGVAFVGGVVMILSGARTRGTTTTTTLTGHVRTPAWTKSDTGTAAPPTLGVTFRF